jgi:hypothetical protein
MDRCPLVLPSTQIIEVEFSEAERSFYESLRARSKLEFEGYVSSQQATQNYAAILTLLLRLRYERKALCQPGPAAYLTKWTLAQASLQPPISGPGAGNRGG